MDCRSRFRFVLYFAVACNLCGCAVFGSSGDDAARPATPPQAKSLRPESGGRYKAEAEQEFDRARVLWRQQHFGLGNAELCSDPQKAVTLLDKVIELEPSYAEAFVRRGLAQSELGRREEAFDDLSAAIRLEPKPEYYAYRALVSMRGGSAKAAVRDIDYSLQKQPKQSRAHNFRGVLALSGDDRAGACAAFAKGCANGDCSFWETAKKEKICP